MTEPNPYAAPREHEPASEQLAPEAVSPGARLVARLWFAGLLGCLALGGVAAMVMRLSAWNATGISWRTFNAAVIMHGSLAVVGLVPAAVMAAASVVAAGMRERPLAAASRLGVAAWAAWVAAVGWAMVRAVFALQPLTMTLWLAIAALAGTAAHVVILIVRRRDGTSALQVLGAGVLAAVCGGLALTMASQEATGYTMGAEGLSPVVENMFLQSRTEPLALLAAGAAGLLALGAEGKSKVGIVYFVLGVAPSLLAWWWLRRLLALPSVDLYLHDTLAATARAHACGSALLCALLALGHSRFHTLTGRGYRQWAAIVAAVPVCGGLLATTVTMFLLGKQGMPARYASHLGQLVPYQRQLTIAAVVAGVGLLLALLVLALPIAGSWRERVSPIKDR